MYFDLYFKGTPYQFASEALRYAALFIDAQHTPLAHLFVEWPQMNTCKPNVDSTGIRILSPNTGFPRLGGESSGMREPATVTATRELDRTRLLVEADNEDGSDLSEWWEKLLAELRRRGLIDEQAQQMGAALGDGQGNKEQAEDVFTVKYLARLRENLVKHSNKEELRTLAFDIGIQHEDLPDLLNPMARELVALCERRKIIPDLVNKLKQMYPQVSWEDKPE